MNRIRRLHDERGVALPMALMTLSLLTTLLLVFGVLAQTEPIIAANQLRVTQARALAESGFEHAVWALSEGVVAREHTPPLVLPAGALDTPLPSPTPAPFDGSVFTVVGFTGGYTVTVTTPAGKPNERLIVSTGWTPNNTAADKRTKARRTIQAVVSRIPNLGLNAPCALCVKGDLGVAGSTTIDSTLDTTCGNKVGTYSAGALTLGPRAEIKGADGNATANQSTDYLTGQAASTFDSFTLSASNLDQLKKLATANGTYFGPGYTTTTNSSGQTTPTSSTYDGTVNLTTANKVKNGIVFIDTISGHDVGAPPDPADFAHARIGGNPFLAGDFTGWIVVNGSLTIAGSMKINGLVYVVNDFTYNATGTGEINGLAISQNVHDTPPTSISSDDDLEANHTSRVTFNCANARSLANVPQTFALEPGTYCERTEESSATCPPI
jgi:hypothetical protein